MNLTHGMRHTATYDIWCGIKYRCNVPTAPAYKNYGGRGVTVCDRWQNNFEAFFEDMGERPEGMTLERIDNDGNYEPGNCEWADRKAQGRNKRNNRLVTIGDETLTLSGWAERSGIKQHTIRYRLESGWPPEVAVFRPLVTDRVGIPRGQPIYIHGGSR